VSEIVDSIGGVQVDLPSGFRVKIQEVDTVFAPGINLISPDNLIPLVASGMNTELGFFWAEKSLLVAVFNDLFSMKNIGNLVSHLKLVSEMHQTDMSPRELARFRDTLQALEQDKTNYLMLPGRMLVSQGDRYWSTDKGLIDMALVQILEGVPPYDKGSLIIDVYNGNGVSGFAGKTATLLQSMEYRTGKVTNAPETEKTHIYFLPAFKLAAMELASMLEVDAVFVEEQYAGSDNPVAIILGRDLIGR
jgi:hypothetical protein